MRLQRLAGYGPTAAFVSAGALVLVIVLQYAGTPISRAAPALAVPTAVVFLLALWVWLAALNVVVFDLEWLEHPDTSTTWFQVARIVTLIALVIPVVMLIAFFAGVAVVVEISYAIIFMAVGLTLLVHNLDANRAHLLRGALPWVGMAAGVAYLIGGLGYLVLIFSSALVPVTWNTLQLGQLLYLVWAIWMGIHLARPKPAAPVAASAH